MGHHRLDRGVALGSRVMSGDEFPSPVPHFEIYVPNETITSPHHTTLQAS